MEQVNSHIVPINMNDQTFLVFPNGEIRAERPRVSPFVLDEVRLAAAVVFILEKRRELTKDQFIYWQNVKQG